MIRPSSIRRPARFAAVGLVNTGLDVGVYLLLGALGFPILLANFLSTCVGLIFSYVANRGFTFGDRAARAPRRQAVLFVGSTGIGLWVLQPIIIVSTTTLFMPPAGADWAVPILLAAAPKGLAVTAGLIWNYCWYSKVVFRASTPTRTQEGAAPARGDLPADLATAKSARVEAVGVQP